MNLDEVTGGRLDLSVRRALLLMGGARKPSRLESAEASGGVRTGAPDEQDCADIAAKIRAARGTGPPVVPGQSIDDDAQALATEIVTRARDLLAALEKGAAFDSITDADAVAFEAVLQVRGRPALRVENRLEPIDDEKHPGSGFWRPFFDQHEMHLLDVASAAGAVVVKDKLGGPQQVCGTAWLIKPDLVVTNRHVLFPPPGGVVLASRVDGASTTARIQTNLDVTVDFAHDNGSARNMIYTIGDIPFVSDTADPVDIALIRVRPTPVLGGAEPCPLVFADKTPSSGYLYVVGHPGTVAGVPEKVMAVFGTPDGRKRVSFGEIMKNDTTPPGEMLHDASTIGGYSGGCVLGFGTRAVTALHYAGHPLTGNRAFTAARLRSHTVACIL